MEEIKDTGKRLSNWGRWGAEDERGALNHITPARLAAAATLVRQGKCFSLSIPLSKDGPQTGAGTRTNPVHLMYATGADANTVNLGAGAGYIDDYIAMPLQCATQWDGLCHVYYDGLLYNGFAAATATSAGAARDGIDKVATGVAGRAVLLDVARFKGAARLDDGYGITAADLDATAAAEGVAVGAGDVVLVRTGLMGEWAATGSWAALRGRSQPGLHVETLPWFAAREVAAIAADNLMVEQMPSAIPGVMVPFHMVAIRDMGLLLGEYWFLEELAADCAADGCYEMFLAAAPLRVTGGAGSPVNPLALK